MSKMLHDVTIVMNISNMSITNLIYNITKHCLPQLFRVLRFPFLCLWLRFCNRFRLCTVIKDVRTYCIVQSNSNDYHVTFNFWFFIDSIVCLVIHCLFDLFIVQYNFIISRVEFCVSIMIKAMITEALTLLAVANAPIYSFCVASPIIVTAAYRESKICRIFIFSTDLK